MTDRMMLINGRHAEELRVAIVENRILQLYDVEGATASQKRGNIYRGVVSNIEKSLNAAFVDFGDEKKGFLTRHDIIPQAFHHKVDDSRRAGIDQVLQKGQPITVQVTRDAEAQKGATLTTNLSVAGRYLVYLPFDEQRGVSRKVEDETLRRKLRDKAKGLEVGPGEGFIIRTNGAEQTKTELKADLQGLTRLWKMVQEEGQRGKGPKLLYDDQNLLVHALRDYLDASIDEVWIDDVALHEEADRYLSATMPRAKVQLKRYEERTPLFSRFNLEPQIAGIYRRVVPLGSGGSIVIDHTEALTAVDVNSGKARQGSNQAETAYRTNVEAANEVARQLRLRDIGGLVVVDFIDMRSRQHQRGVEKALREAMKLDRARHSLSHISANGLLEINRQRIRRALQLRTHRACPTCEGVGRLISPELSSLSLMRRIEARAATGRLLEARVALHPDLANFTQNKRRAELAALERSYDIRIEIISDRRVEPSGERIEWKNREEVKWPEQADEDRRAVTTSERKQREPVEAKPLSSSSMIESEREEERGGEEEDGERSSRRSRRRRRRRRRGRGDGERSQEGAEGASPQEASAPPSTEEADASAAADEQTSAEATNEDGAASQEEEGGPEARRSSRRRRRRRRRRPEGSEPATGGAAVQPSTSGSSAPEPTPPPIAASSEHKEESSHVAAAVSAASAKPLTVEERRDAVADETTAPAKKATTKKRATKKAATKKATSKKTASKKAATKKAATKKATTKKATTKKVASKKATTKKAATKKVAAKKKATKKKAAAAQEG